MKHTSSEKIFKTNCIVVIILFGILFTSWNYLQNSFQLFRYSEELQLFRTDFMYFNSYINRSGGLVDYISSFLVQFYSNPLLGSAILSSIIVLIYFIILAFTQKIVPAYRVYILFFAIPFLLAAGSLSVPLSFIISIFLSVFFFYIYALFRGEIRFPVGIIFFVLIYLLSGGGAFLFLALLLIDELMSKKNILYVIAIIAVSLLIPYLANNLYIENLKDSYLSYTPFSPGIDNKFYLLAWIAIPVLYFITRLLFSGKPNYLTKGNKIILIGCYSICIMAACGWFYVNMGNKDRELILKMAYEVENANWDEVLRISKLSSLKKDAVLTAYFTNIALMEKGLMGSDLFKYNQTGRSGIFLQWQSNSISPMYNGELYYRLGIIPEAEHSAYESLEASPKEHNSKMLRRLVYTNMLKGDSLIFNKYIQLFEKSPVYARWAKNQRDNFNILKNNPNAKIGNLPKILHTDDFFINYDLPEYNLIRILHNYPDNKKAYEYLVSALLVAKDINTFISSLDKYYNEMDYKGMPELFQEAILVYRSYNPQDTTVIGKYALDENIILKFNDYAEKSKSAVQQKDIDKLKFLYGDTFWFYYQYTEPLPLNPVNAPGRY